MLLCGIGRLWSLRESRNLWRPWDPGSRVLKAGFGGSFRFGCEGSFLPCVGSVLTVLWSGCGCLLKG